MRFKNFLKVFFSFIASILLIVSALLSSVQLVAYADPEYRFFEYLYKNFNVASKLDMSMDDIMDVTGFMMSYLVGNEDELSYETSVDGKKQDFFNEQDRAHMADVQKLFIKGLTLRNLFLALSVVIFVFLFIFEYLGSRSNYDLGWDTNLDSSLDLDEDSSLDLDEDSDLDLDSNLDSNSGSNSDSDSDPDLEMPSDSNSDSNSDLGPDPDSDSEMLPVSDLDSFPAHYSYYRLYSRPSKRSWQFIFKGYSFALMVFVLAIIALIVCFVLNFTETFEVFHHLFFDNNLYSFNPAYDYMIRMLPEDFFLSMAIAIIIVFAVLLVILWFVFLIASREKSSNYEAKHTV